MNRLAALTLVAICSSSCGIVSPSAGDLQRDPHGHLVWAARTGDVAAIRALAASGLDLNAASDTPGKFVFPDLDHKGWTALQHAVQKRQVDAVRALLASGANPDARPSGSAITPLIIAAAAEDQTIVQLLLDAGADLNLSRKGLTQEDPGGPLWHAVERTMERVKGSPSRQEALDRIKAAPPSQH